MPLLFMAYCKGVSLKRDPQNYGIAILVEDMTPF
jgi:hypothetical protein